MDIFHPSDLRSLIAHKGKWCVSIYMPTHRIGLEQQHDPVLLKNLLAEAEAKLLANGLRRAKVQALMQPAEDLLVDRGFWQYQGDGLAIFLSNDFSATYRLPAHFEALLTINKSFHTQPLYPLLKRVGKFYLLFVSMNDIRLFEATADSIDEIHLNLPSSMDQAVGMDNSEKHLDVLSDASQRSEGNAQTLRFFQSASQAIQTLLEEEHLPMFLAGGEQIVPIFREACTYENILESYLRGNPEEENLKAMHGEACQIAGPLFEEMQKRAFEKFNQLYGQHSDLAVSDLKTALRAAKVGQVETLFLPVEEGHQEPGRHAMDPVIPSDQENEDLLDRAATETILNSGQVFSVPRYELPDDGDLAAILRVPIHSY